MVKNNQLFVFEKAKDILKLIRISHWVKNFFIFLPAFFATTIFDIHTFKTLLITFLVFSFLASSVYIINDLKDKDEDAKHPKKQFRPIASGKIDKITALFLLLFLLSSSFIIAYFLLPHELIFILFLYLLNNIVYSLWLRYIGILDVMSIASGFILRIFAGSVVVDIELSKWIIIMTFLLSIFLGLAKRRDDVLIFEKTKQKMRKTVSGYNLSFIDSAMQVMAGVILVSYIMYSTSVEVVDKFQVPNLYVNSFWVIAGILRYMQITLVEEKTASPTKILIRDKFLQLTIVGWVLTFLILLYY